MKTISIRIVIPSNVGELLNLASLIFAKHQSDGAASPLHALADDPWDEFGPKIQEAIAKHQEAEEFMRRAEQAYRDRDRLVGDLSSLIKRTRDLLKAIYKKIPKKLGEWGFIVNDTPKGTKLKV